MVKLIVQIPCLNEEKTLPLTIRDIPRKIDGVDSVEILVIDDGSTDRTAEVAEECGADHIIRFKKWKGLARAFMAGLEYSLKRGADIIVNIDGDHIFRGEDIPKLIDPILAEKADITVGSRDMGSVRYYSWMKRKLHKLGSWVIRKLSETDVDDATCGFRAFGREAAFQMNVISLYTYTLETLIQAGHKQLFIRSVPIGLNEKERESRLIKRIPHYIGKSMVTMLRIFTLYQPLKAFSWLGGIFFLSGFVLGLRYIFLQFIIISQKESYASLILCAVLLILGTIFFIMGLLADLIGSNRHLIDNALLLMKKSNIDRDKKKDRYAKIAEEGVEEYEFQ